MAFSDVLLETLTDGATVGDNWGTATFRLRVNTDRIDAGRALEDLGAGEGWFEFVVRHAGHPDMGFALNVLRRLERGAPGGELVLSSVTTAAPERQQIGVSASGEAIYAP